MSYFNVSSYRDEIRKRLVESDSLGIGGVHLNKESEKPQYETDVLQKLREKLFGTDESIASIEDEGDENDKPVDIDNEDSLKPDADLGGLPNDTAEPELTNDDLADMATDTIMDILNSIKELRDEVKKEDPKKAALIRRIYDHLLKGKEKITSEILKSAEEEKNGSSDESKW